MRRRVIQVALCLLLGAIVNVAVAWRCFLDGRMDQSLLNWSDGGLRVGLATPDDIAFVAKHAPAGIAPPTGARQQTLRGYRLRVLSSSGQSINASMCYRAGWPLLAVGGEEFRWRPQAALRDQ